MGGPLAPVETLRWRLSIVRAGVRLLGAAGNTVADRMALSLALLLWGAGNQK